MKARGGVHCVLSRADSERVAELIVVLIKHAMLGHDPECGGGADCALSVVCREAAESLVVLRQVAIGEALPIAVARIAARMVARMRETEPAPVTNAPGGES